MKRLFLACSALALCSSPSFAQSGSLPPVYFPAGKDLCEDEAWKLVFQDDFNGTTLKPHWNTFSSWSGMDGDDNPNWSEARTGEPHNCIYLDKNIYVNDGTVKLMVFREPATIDTGMGPWVLAQYTSSILIYCD